MEAPVTPLKYPHLALKTMHGFLDESLTPGEMEATEAHILECQLCATALENIARDPDDGRAARTDAFATAFRAGMDDLAPASQDRNWNGVFRIAAMVLLVLNIGWAALYFSGGQVPAFSPYPVDVQKSAATEALTEALAPYTRGDYAASIPLLQALPDGPAIVERKLLYLGSASLALGQPDLAIPPLERLVGQPDWILYRADARRYLSIAYRDAEKKSAE